MILQLCSVRDLATETYGRPFTVNHQAQAIRSFMDECNNPESEIAKHAKDYELFSLGTVCDQTGQLVPYTQRLARAIDLQRPQE